MLIAFHKPYGVLSQFTPDGSPNRPLAEFGFPKNVYPIGRLDADSEGLLLLSDEVEWNARLLEPRHAHEREYWAQVERIPSAEALQQLSRGLVIQSRKTLPCRAWLLEPQPVVTSEFPAADLPPPRNVGQAFQPAGAPDFPVRCSEETGDWKVARTGGQECPPYRNRERGAPMIFPRTPPVRFRKSVPDCWIALELIEGKNRQVRRMTAAIGHPTLRLVRVRIGRFLLGDLPPGKWKVLSETERSLVASR